MKIKLNHDKSINQTIIEEHPGLDLSQYEIKVDNDYITLTKTKPKIDYASVYTTIIKKHIHKFELDSSVLVDIVENEYDDVEYEYHHTSSFVADLLADIAENSELDDFGFTIYIGYTANQEIVISAYFDGQLEELDDVIIDIIKISNIAISKPNDVAKAANGKICLSNSYTFTGDVTILV